MRKLTHGASGERPVEWVHPSWRDLGVQFLIENGAERQRFLDRANLHGIMLSLSVAGGPAGNLELPLAIDSTDWELICLSSCRLVASTGGGAAAPLLSALDSVRMCLWEKPVSDPRRRDFMKLVDCVLAACRSAWGASEAAVDLYALGLYAKLSLTVHPLPPNPPLERTWAAAWEKAATSASDNCGYCDLALNAFEAAVDLAAFVQANEPRLLLQTGFPDSYLGHALATLNNVAPDVADPLECDSNSDFVDEIERLAGLPSALQSIASAFPSTEERSSQLAADFERISEALEEEQRAKYPAKDDGDDGVVPPDDRDHFSIADIFSDL